MKRINGEDMAAKVFLLPGMVVLKQYYHPTERRSKCMLDTHWKKEVAALKRLVGIPHFPQLIRYSDSERQIVMAYCGDCVTKETLPADWVEQCNWICRKLSELKMYHNDVFCKNICVKDGDLYLIDWGLWAEVPYKNNSMIQAIKGELGV